MQRIKKGDTVEVIAGKDKGQRGQVLSVLPKEKRIVVERVNIVKKHQRPVQAGRGQMRAGIIEFEASIDLSNVQLVCKSCGEKTRVGFRVDEEGKKVRVCKKCGQDIG
ncbi:MAG: 50S ribosomal protein L24 [Anaerolinea sp.]|nr:50S ribosomal protein L24 [Anaerolinea sp.]MCC6972675.1 50S ribosomal protein L24 [Anaerolineae bacterium]